MPGGADTAIQVIEVTPGTPTDVTRKISDAIGAGFRQPDVQERIKKLEADPLGSTPETMRKMIKESEDIWGPVVKAANITID